MVGACAEGAGQWPCPGRCDCPGAASRKSISRPRQAGGGLSTIARLFVHVFKYGNLLWSQVQMFFNILYWGTDSMKWAVSQDMLLRTRKFLDGRDKILVSCFPFTNGCGHFT